MARSNHSTYTAADRYERRHAARARQHRRHLHVLAIRAEIAEVS